MTKEDSVWVFQGEGAKCPSAIYSSKEKAVELIQRNKLTGLLTRYPLNSLVYDWAVENKYFIPVKNSHKTISFRQNFTSGSQEHYHYENGESG